MTIEDLLNVLGFVSITDLMRCDEPHVAQYNPAELRLHLAHIGINPNDDAAQICAEIISENEGGH